MTLQALLGLLFPSAYRDVGYVAGTWFGNDLVTLLGAVPLLLAGLALDRHASTTGRLLWLGALAYAVYNSAFYLLGAALNAFFPLYALTVVTSAAALILLLAATPASAVAARFRPTTPNRLIGAYFVTVSVCLTAVWLAMWAGYVFGGRPTPGAPEEFRLVAALDLTLMVPAMAVGGALLWQRRPWGFVITPLAGIQSTLYLFLLALNSVLFVLRGDSAGTGQVWIWSGLFLGTGLATMLLLANLRDR